ncbi:type II CAAX prenyl endopeptidase Rce1 family protein [Prolixibacter sp. SD074]|uniref:CPBP family glutamic-type intramembrane protease n=1 Tax=Prolixibacter sp. SD074 TaxID=2652391 RepID=UPI00188E50C1|nr:CPBP family glutamic-type intramembrane protease [Prolixibacter sp. SD074]
MKKFDTIIFVVRYMKRLNVLIFILIGVSALLLISFLILLFQNITGISIGNGSENPLLNESKFFVLIIGILIIPFFETLIFQALPFYVINKLIRHKRKLWMFLIVSPILFSLNHLFNPAYILATYFGGLALALIYYIGYYRKENAILLVAVIHLINNLVAFIFRYLIGS